MIDIKMMSQSKTQQGFTTLEVVVVLLCLAILVGLTFIFK